MKSMNREVIPIKRVDSAIKVNRDAIYLLLRHYLSLNRSFLLQSDLWDEYQLFMEKAEPETAEMVKPLAKTVEMIQEAVLHAPWIYVAIRPDIAWWQYYRFHIDTLKFTRIEVEEFLSFKEKLALKRQGDWVLEIDMDPFSQGLPRLKETRSIGNGMQFLNRRLSSQMIRDSDEGSKSLLKFL